MDVESCFSVFVMPVMLILLSKWLWHLYILAQRDQSCPLPLPPGNMGWPIVGEMFDFVATNLRGGDFFVKHRLKYGRVYKTYIMGRPMVRVTGAENLRPILLGEHYSVRTQWPASIRTLIGPRYSLAMAEGEIHKIRRKKIQQAFSKPALEGYTEPLQLLICEELRRWCRQENVTVFHEAQSLNQRAALQVLIGFSDMTEQEKAQVTQDVAMFVDGFFTFGWSIPGSKFYKARQARERILQLLERQMSKDADTLNFRSALSIIMDAHEDSGQNTEKEEVLELMLELIFTGHLTLRSAITSLVLLLGRHPEVVEKIKAEMVSKGLPLDADVPLTLDQANHLPYTHKVVREVLRLNPPVGGAFRTALKTLQIQGYQIPKGWTVVYGIKDSHDFAPEFMDPQDFNPDRWDDLTDNKAPVCLFLSFGAGARTCVGKDFAKLFLWLLTVNLVRMCEWKLTSPTTQMRRFPNYHPVDGLPTIFKQRLSEQHKNRNGETDNLERTKERLRQRYLSHP